MEAFKAKFVVRYTTVTLGQSSRETTSGTQNDSQMKRLGHNPQAGSRGHCV